MRKGSKQGPRIDGQARQPPDPPFAEAAEEFCKVKETEGRAEQTIKTYRYHIRYFLDFAGDGVRCSEITRETLTAYLEHLRGRGITNPVTLNTHIGNISPIVHYTWERGYSPHRYLMPVVVGQEKEKPPYTTDELALILSPPDIVDFTHVRTWAIVWTLASTGIRARELRELRIENVDTANMLVHLQATKNKKPRRVPISSALYSVLLKYADVRHPENAEPGDPYFCTVYGQKLTSTTLSDSVREWTRAKGVDRTDTGGLHIFRHTFITEAVRTGVSPMMLQRVTGHSTMQQLGRYYHERVEDMRDVVERVTPEIKQDRRRKF